MDKRMECFCDGVLDLDRAEAVRQRGTFLILLINCYFMYRIRLGYSW